MNAGIRTISGIRFLIDEITTFEQINTNMVANPIPIPLMAEEVVPNVGPVSYTHLDVYKRQELG